MNFISNHGGDQRNHEQLLRGNRRWLVRGAIQLAAFLLAFFGAMGIRRSTNLINASAVSSYLMLLMSLALILISMRWLPPLSSSKPFSRLRRRIGVAAHFAGVFVFLVMVQVAMFRIPLHESSLQLYLWLVIALIAMYLGILLGKPIMALYQDLGFVWHRNVRRLDERELQLRQRALAMTCQILIVAILLAGVFLCWIDSRPWIASTPYSIASLSLLLLTYIGSTGLALPTAILAWTEPEPSSADSWS